MLLVMCQTMETTDKPADKSVNPSDISQINVPNDPFYFHTANQEKTWLITPTAPGPIHVEVTSQSQELLEITLNGEKSQAPIAQLEGQGKILLEHTLDQATLDHEKRFYITVRWAPQVRSISLELDVKGSISISYPELKIEN